MMRALLLLGLSALVALSMPVKAQEEKCEFFSEKAANELERVLQNAATCTAAVKTFDECRWGSSADVGFARIVIEKCEQNFLPALNRAQKARYIEEMQLCNYEYEKQQGTLYISEASSCHVYVAERFSENPALANQPMPRASFDCHKAKTPLEKAICSDRALGRADVILGKAYKPLLSSVKGKQRTALIKAQKEWLAQASQKCGVSSEPLQQSVRNCMKEEFENRFMDLDECGVGGVLACLSGWESNNN